MLRIIDSFNSDSQLSSTVAIAFQHQSINTGKLTATTSYLGSTAALVLSFTTQSKYRAGYKLTFDLTSDFGLPSGIVNCLSSVIMTPTCTISGTNATITGSVGTLTAGTNFTVTLNDIQLPRCPKSVVVPFTSLSSTFIIEKGSASFNGAALSTDSITLQSLITTTTNGQESNTITIEFSHNITLNQGSLVILTLPSEAKYTSTTTCAILQGLEAGAICTNKGSGVVWFELGMNTAQRLPAAGNIRLRLTDLSNPRGLGNYQINLEVSTNSTSGCVYSSKTMTLIVSSIPSMISASFVPSNSYRNSLEEYNFSITPKSTSIVSSDSIEISFPSIMALSESVQCSALSSNIISTACTRTSDRVLTIRPTISAAAYTSNQTLKVMVKYIRNPDISGLVADFVVDLKDITGNNYENYTGMSHKYEGFMTPSTAKVVFKDDKVGNFAEMTIDLKLPSLIHAKSSIILQLSSKFSINPKTFLIYANSFPISLSSINPSTNTITLTVNFGIPADTSISLTLKASNPSHKSISASDARLSLLTPDSMQLFSIDAASDRLSFTCVDNCVDCAGVYDNCTACAYGYYILADGRCGLVVVHQQALPYFVFIGSALGMFLFMVFYGKVFRRVNYWGNRMFSMFKVIMVLFLAYFTYTWASNPVGQYLKYLSFGILGMHVLLNLGFYYCLRYPTLKPNFSVQHVEVNGHMLAVNPIDEENVDNSTLEKKYRVWQELLSIIGVIISLTLSRWFFSGPKTQKGLYWYHRHSDFRRLKIAFEIYELLCELLLLLPVVALCIYTLVRLKPEQWHWYMIECLALCLMNICLHFIAFCELIPIKKPREDESYLANTSKDINLHKIGASNSKDKSLLMDQTIKDDINAKPDRVSFQDPLNQKSIGRLFHGKKSLTNLLNISDGVVGESEDNGQSSKRILRDEESRDNGSIRIESISSLMIVPQTRLQAYRAITPETLASSSQQIGLRQLDVDLNRRDLDIRLPSRQQTMTDSVADSYSIASPDTRKIEKLTEVEYVPLNVKRNQFKLFPQINMIKSPSGIIQPQLKDKPVELREIKLDPVDKEIQENQAPGAISPKPQKVLDDKEESALKYKSEKTDLDYLAKKSKVKAPEKSRFLENQLFSKWWFNNEAKKYLEIVYEEEDEAPRIHENSQYEGSPEKDYGQKTSRSQLSDSKFNFSTSDAALRSSKWPERYINGQFESDLNRGIIKDRNGVIMNLRDHKKRCFSEGIFMISHLAEKIHLNAQNPALFIKGLIRDVEGRLYRIIDQDYEMLKDGIYLARDGKIDNINGQKPSEIDLGVFRDITHRSIDLKEQDPGCFDNNKIYTQDGLLLEFEEAQDPSRFSLGLILTPDGKEYRLKDQDLKELSQYRVYRDRDLNPLKLPKHLLLPHNRKPVIIIDEVDDPEKEESPKVTMAHPLKRKFGRSKESVHSGSKQGESRRSWHSGGPENQRIDAGKDSMHHYRMTPIVDNTKHHDNSKSNFQNTRHSFESFGPIPNLQNKQRLTPKNRSDDNEITQRSESNLIDKPKSKQLSRQQSYDQVSQRLPPASPENPTIPLPHHHGQPLNDTQGTNQSSNLLYEQHLKDHSADHIASHTHRLAHTITDPDVSVVPESITRHRHDDTGSFVNPFKTLDAGRGKVGSREKMLDDSILENDDRYTDKRGGGLKDGKDSGRGYNTQRNSIDSLGLEVKGKREVAKSKPNREDGVIIPKFREFKKNKSESSSKIRLLGPNEPPEKQTGGFKLIENPERQHNETINMDIPLPMAMSTGSGERFTPTRRDSSKLAHQSPEALNQLIDKMSNPKMMSRPQSNLSKTNQVTESFMPNSTGGGQASLYHRSSLSKRGEQSLRPMSGDRRSSAESYVKPDMGRISEVQARLESSPIDPKHKSPRKNNIQPKPVQTVRLEIPVPEISNDNSIMKSQSKVNLDTSRKHSNNGSSRVVKSKPKRDFKKTNSQVDISNGSSQHKVNQESKIHSKRTSAKEIIKDTKAYNIDIEGYGRDMGQSTGRNTPNRVTLKGSQLIYPGSLDDIPVRETPDSRYSQTNYHSRPYSQHRMNSMATGGRGTDASSMHHGQESDYNTMLLNLVMDESLDIELDIEVVDDDDVSHSRMDAVARFDYASRNATPRAVSVDLPEEPTQQTADLNLNRRVRLEDIASKYMKDRNQANAINFGEK